jgi:hypothetical protein
VGIAVGFKRRGSGEKRAVTRDLTNITVII